METSSDWLLVFVQAFYVVHVRGPLLERSLPRQPSISFFLFQTSLRQTLYALRIITVCVSIDRVDITTQRADDHGVYFGTWCCSFRCRVWYMIWSTNEFVVTIKKFLVLPESLSLLRWVKLFPLACS
jgi:hypothetical protein